ncbi:hypothetical protein KTO58_19685 [Chitinophaga pendula]|uniref:hypothetical protein n=1 Tax=Chitinophaga TaxID=79328 RepID=UPI000BAF3455|nr:MULTISPECIES: hypothetical protein [Chitinophaga]ASZ11110.1 hypothetical protein CK934_09115 [Chitinophaga sp. MD30]UCJ05892.1 hypothetical protein KTO58_19685 [Chitinophaga pendula]
MGTKRPEPARLTKYLTRKEIEFELTYALTKAGVDKESIKEGISICRQRLMLKNMPVEPAITEAVEFYIGWLNRATFGRSRQ